MRAKAYLQKQLCRGLLTRTELKYKIVARFTKLPKATACHFAYKKI